MAICKYCNFHLRYISLLFIYDVRCDNTKCVLDTCHLCYFIFVYSLSMWISILEIVQHTVKAKVREHNRGKESWRDTKLTPFEELCMVRMYTRVAFVWLCMCLQCV